MAVRVSAHFRRQRAARPPRLEPIAGTLPEPSPNLDTIPPRCTDRPLPLDLEPHQCLAERPPRVLGAPDLEVLR
jgi:hypothetical protein